MTSSCDAVRESLSARIDGEDGLLSTAEVDVHVVGCDGCTAFAAGLPTLAERVAAFRAVPVEDRTAAVLSAAPARRRSRAGTLDLRRLLGLAAVVQLVVGVVALAGVGGDHVARDLAVLQLATAVGLGAAAWRPRMALGLLPVIALAAVAGVVTMVGDVAAGSTSVAAEFSHLVLAVATWPLVVLARREDHRATVRTA